MMNVEYYVEYVDEYGNTNSEIWSQSTLDTELARGEVKITKINLAYDLLVKLGVVEDD